MAVPLSLLGLPRPAWCYYVLVGSYDGFAEDNFRPVMAKPGEWHFGGGRDDAWDPNVIDLLAPPRGRCSQERQLGSFDVARGEYAVLFPVGPRCRPGRGIPWLPMTLLVFLLVFGWLLWSLVSWLVGTTIFGGKADWGEMLRVIGFAYSPQILGIIPCIGGIAGAIWSLIAGFVAIRQGLDLDNLKAFLTIVIGFIVYIILYAILGVVLGGLGALLGIS